MIATGLGDSLDLNSAPAFTMSSDERTYTSSSGNFPTDTVTVRGPTLCQIRNAEPSTARAEALPISKGRVTDCLIVIGQTTIFSHDEMVGQICRL